MWRACKYIFMALTLIMYPYFKDVLHTVHKFKKFPPRNLFFVSTVEKFQILVYRKVAILPQGPVWVLRAVSPPSKNNTKFLMV